MIHTFRILLELLIDGAVIISPVVTSHYKNFLLEVSSCLEGYFKKFTPKYYLGNSNQGFILLHNCQLFSAFYDPHKIKGFIYGTKNWNPYFSLMTIIKSINNLYFISWSRNSSNFLKTLIFCRHMTFWAMQPATLKSV